MFLKERGRHTHTKGRKSSMFLGKLWELQITFAKYTIFFFFFLFFGYAHGCSIQKFPRSQGLNPSHSSDNSGSLTHWASWKLLDDICDASNKITFIFQYLSFCGYGVQGNSENPNRPLLQCKESILSFNCTSSRKGLKRWFQSQHFLGFSSHFHFSFWWKISGILRRLLQGRAIFPFKKAGYSPGYVRLTTGFCSLLIRSHVPSK